MYNFVDINGVSESVLPSEALCLNGEYLENIVPGYRTLNVAGREALSKEVETFETGIRDGAFLKNRRYPSRTIIVKYQIIAETPEEFREAFNQLAKALDVQNAEMIFNDEPDKFFRGTPVSVGDVDPGRNAVTGEIEFLCVDPFKYSCVEYEAEPESDDGTVALIDYNGTYRSFPILEADFFSESDASEDGESTNALTGSGDCGFVAFFNENAKIVQLGDPDEKDGETVGTRSQTLINQTFTQSTSWGTAASGLWSKNSGTVMPSSVSQIGTMDMAVESYDVQTVAKDTSGTLLNKKKTTSSEPKFYWTVKAKATNRTANSVKITFAITAAMAKSSNYFGKGYKLVASVYVNGSWHNVTMKDTNTKWNGNSGHTKNITVTVTGLSESTTAVTGIKFKATRPDGKGSAGKLSETACGNMPVSIYSVSTPEGYYLKPTSYGSTSGVWHGAAISRNIPADALGASEAGDFILSYRHRMSIGTGGNDQYQLGAFQAMLSSASGSIVAGLRISKGSAGKTATINYYVGGIFVGSASIDISYSNKYLGKSGVQTCSVTKTGSTVTFNIGGYSRTFVNSSVANVKATKLTFSFEQYSGNAALYCNGIYSVKFVKNNCNTYKDIPNKFSADDVVTADCSNGEIRLNGILSPNLGALGNDWEDFYLVPGLNQIGVTYSDWVDPEHAPAFKIRYREVYL